MGSDLVRRSAQLTTSGRFQRPGRVITRDLRKKERLTRRDKFWIYNDFVALGVSSLVLIGSVALLISTKDKHPLIATIAAATATMGLLSLILSFALSNTRVNEQVKAHFDHKARRAIVEGERSRRMAPHASKRKTRERELVFNYLQYSVDVRYELDKNAVTLTLLEHSPWKDDRYLSEPLSLTKGMIADIAGSGLIMENTINGVIEVHPADDSSKAVEAIMQRVADIQATMEIVADGLEEMAYDREKARILTRRVALQARR